MRLGTYYRSELLRRLGVTHAKGRILDVGGFDGYWLSTVEADAAYSLDVDVVRGFPSVTYLRGDGQQLPLRSGAFDTVFALDVIEHVDHEESFVGELMRVLKPGGKLYLTTPHENIRIFPASLTPWANRRWQHHRSGAIPLE